MPMLRYALKTISVILVLVTSGHAEVIDRIVAVVNDKVITSSDLEDEIAIRRQLQEAIERPSVLDSMIEREVVAAEAGRLGIVVPLGDVTRATLNFEETFSSTAEFNRFLELYELRVQDLSRRFAEYIAVDKVREQKEAVSAGRYEKWLTEAKKKADIRIQPIEDRQ